MENPRLEHTAHGATVFYSRYLYSRHNPAHRPIAAARAVCAESRCLYIVPSPLLGYGLAELTESIPADSHVLAIEASQELFHLCSPHFSPGLLNNPKLTIVRLSDEASLNAVLENLGLWRFRRVRQVDLNGGAALHAPLYDSLIAFALEAQSSYWHNWHSLRIMGRHWVRHLFANLRWLPAALPYSSGDLPIVIAGAGPSLEESLNFIKKKRNLIELWATDTALGTLFSAGISPDVVTVLETQFWNHLDFHGAADRKITILADICSYPGSLTIPGCKISLFSSSFTELRLLNRLRTTFPNLPVIPPLGSVGLAAVQLALSFSTQPILLTGLDFSCVPGKSHAQSSSFHKWMLFSRSRLNPMPGWSAAMDRPRVRIKNFHGEEILSDGILAGYANHFRKCFSSSRRLFSLTGMADLGIPLLTESTAEAQLKSAQPTVPSAVNQSSPYSETLVNEFIAHEIQLLQETILRWNEYSSGGKAPEGLLSALEDIDHLYCGFPDEPPLPKSDNNFLFRAITRCRELYGDLIRFYPGMK
ncbi:MAG: hypothetical protein B0D92_05220 [Spirochaeta sp. LUC14_002_19_P3]|nr:MAG: hypothetical protein B0D92_05220 [Spirochaeta sp. LUC14_002_19_P3]